MAKYYKLLHLFAVLGASFLCSLKAAQMLRRLILGFLIFSTLIPPAMPRMGGGGGRGRGSSGARMGGSRMGGGRINSGGSLFGRKNTGGNYPQQPNRPANTGFNSNMGRKPDGTGFHRSHAPPSISTYSHSGIGSRARTSQFKNMLVGAAAGFLTYQAGKHIIRNIGSAMMWNNRPYYWGPSYFRPQRGYTQMCRMPYDQDPQFFGDIYEPNGISRPKEIVWGCGPYERCCGMECCYVRSSPHGHSPYTIGSLLGVLMFSLLGVFIAYRICNRRRA